MFLIIEKELCWCLCNMMLINRPRKALSDQQMNQYVPTAESLFSVDAGCFTGSITEWGLVAYNQSGVAQFSALKRETIEIDPVSAEALGVR